MDIISRGQMAIRYLCPPMAGVTYTHAYLGKVHLVTTGRLLLIILEVRGFLNLIREKWDFMIIKVGI